jgi:hypothetical protein
MKRRLHRRATTLVVFAMAVVLGHGYASLIYRCAYDHVARTSCCCSEGAAKSQEQLPSSPSIKARCCCSIEQVKAAAVAATTRSALDATAVIRPMVIVSIVEVRPAVLAVIAMDREARPPPRPASLFEQRISFLV